MDIKKLKVVLDSIELGSFSKAAAKHGYTSSALIYIADSIEDELGVKLINRSSFGISPAKEGEALLPMLRELCVAEDNIKRAASELKNGRRKVTVGCYSSVAKSFMPNKLAQIRKNLPDIEVSLVIKDSIGEMSANGADIFLVNKSECRGRDYTPLYKDHYVAVINENCFEGASLLTRKDLCDHPFIMPNIRSIKESFSELDTEIISINADDDSAIIEMVRSGIGNTVLTSNSIKKSEIGIKTLPLSPDMENEIVLTCDKQTKDIKRVVKILVM